MAWHPKSRYDIYGYLGPTKHEKEIFDKIEILGGRLACYQKNRYRIFMVFGPTEYEEEIFDNIEILGGRLA